MALPAYTYNNGTLGVGATLTGSAISILSLDSSVLVAGQRVLIMDESGANEPYNGIYVVTNNDGITAWVLTRASDCDEADEISNAAVFVEKGTVLYDTMWVCTTNTPIVVGTTPLKWVQVAASEPLAAGGGIEIHGTNPQIITVELDPSGPGLAVQSAGLKLNFSTATLFSDATIDNANDLTSLYNDSSGKNEKISIGNFLLKTGLSTAAHKYSTLVAYTGISGQDSITVTHNLGTQAVLYGVRDTDADEIVSMDADTFTINSFILRFNVPNGSVNNYEITVIG